MMKCPSCDHPLTKVIDSRDLPKGLVTRRRRECLKCQERYTTYERIEAEPEDPGEATDRDLILTLRRNLAAQQRLVQELLHRIP
jgi:transcriptional regulator NrdR family protein